MAAVSTHGDWNDCGQLGNGTTTDKNAPTKIMDNVISVSLGNWHSAAITSDRAVFTLGEITAMVNLAMDQETIAIHLSKSIYRMEKLFTKQIKVIVTARNGSSK